MFREMEFLCRIGFGNGSDRDQVLPQGLGCGPEQNRAVNTAGISEKYGSHPAEQGPQVVPLLIDLHCGDNNTA